MRRWCNPYEEPDRQGEGGNIAEGIRLVRPGGRIKFDSFWYSHERLIPFVGRKMKVYATDIWRSDYVGIHHPGLVQWICDAEVEGRYADTEVKSSEEFEEE